MNGYAAVYETEKRLTDSFGDNSVEGYVGQVHAAEVDAAGEPVSETLCGRATDDLNRVRSDKAADSFDTWYPPVPEVRLICGECDGLTAA